MSRVLVVGATGALGSAVAARLSSAGASVRALVRPGSDAAELERLGVDLAAGDLKDPASLARASGDADAIVCTASATQPAHRRDGDSVESVDRDGCIALVDAAERAGVRRLVFVSTATRDGNPATNAKRAVEERLAASTLPHAVLQPTRFMEIWLSPALGFDPRAGRARIFGAGDAQTSWVARRDVAELAGRVALEPAKEVETLTLGGPEPLSQLDVVRIFERVSGRRFELEHVSEEELRSQLASDPRAGLMLAATRGQPVDSSETLRRYPLTRTSVREYAEAVCAGGGVGEGRSRHGRQPERANRASSV